MLLDRNQVVIGVVAIVLIAVGTFFGITATTGGFVPGKLVRAEFTDAAGLEEGAFVFVAGVRAGRVESVEIAGDVVEVSFKLDAEVPADSGADIFLNNLLGKRAVKVIPGVSEQTLAEGELIPVERTGTPVDLPELGDETVDLLGGTDVEALQNVTTALADVTEGARDDVEALIDGIDRLTRVVSRRKSELATAIDRTEDLVDAAADKDREIVRIIDAFGSTLDRLAQRRADLTRLLDETAATSTLAADLVEDKRAVLDRVLSELHTDLEILDRRQVEVAHALAYSGVSIDGFASIGYRGGDDVRDDNPSWGNVFTTGLGQLGVQALLGCGGALDQALTELVGPDPSCDGTSETSGDAGDASAPSAPAPGSPFTSLRSLVTDALPDSSAVRTAEVAR